MSGAEWGITADEARAIMAEADGAVLVRGGWGRGSLVHQGRLIEVTSRAIQIHAKGKGGVWYDLDSVKPAAGKSRNLVDALRAKRARAKEQAIEQIDRIMNQQETPMPQENPMPPDHAPRPLPKAKPILVAPTTNAALDPGSITLAAAGIERALKEVEARRADVAAADRDLAAARDLVESAQTALDAAEAQAKKLANDFNALVKKITG